MRAGDKAEHGRKICRQRCLGGRELCCALPPMHSSTGLCFRVNTRLNWTMVSSSLPFLVETETGNILGRLLAMHSEHIWCPPLRAYALDCRRGWWLAVFPHGGILLSLCEYHPYFQFSLLLSPFLPQIATLIYSHLKWNLLLSVLS